MRFFILNAFVLVLGVLGWTSRGWSQTQPYCGGKFEMVAWGVEQTHGLPILRELFSQENPLTHLCQINPSQYVITSKRHHKDGRQRIHFFIPSAFCSTVPKTNPPGCPRGCIRVMIDQSPRVQSLTTRDSVRTNSRSRARFGVFVDQGVCLSPQDYQTLLTQENSRSSSAEAMPGN